MADPKVLSTNVTGGTRYTNMSASALVKNGEGDLVGIWVASTSAGTVKLWDAITGVAPILINTSSLNTGWNSMPFHFNTGLYCTIGGTIDCTVSWS